MSQQDGKRVQGEGNYRAARRFRKEAEEFANDEQRVKKAARDAAPDSAAQQRELEDAEQAGRDRARS
ncbi:MAG: hypothetical protein R3E77_06500 [Steroidobacteraceae bacterium]